VTLQPHFIGWVHSRGEALKDSFLEFRNVAGRAPSIIAGSPITSGPSLADQLLL
jgi:hypothetical protein